MTPSLGRHPVIDWPDLLDRHGIGYDGRGRSVSAGNINVECPWCRDGKRKLGIHLRTGHWGCRKRNDHRGRGNNPRMLSALLGITTDAAREILGTRVVDASIEALLAQLQALDAPPPPPTLAPLPTIELPLELFALREYGRMSAPFVEYLADRGLPFGAVERYGLHGCLESMRSQLVGRVYLPLYDGGRLVGYTGRSIDDDPQRYETQPPAAPSRVLGLSQLALGGHVLVVVEGPFDALVLDWVAHTLGLPVSVVCLMGSASTRAKNRALAALVRSYDRAVILLDRGAEAAALELQRAVPGDLSVESLPDGVDDPGDLTHAAAATALMSFIR